MPTGKKLRCAGVQPPFQICLVEPEIPPNTGSVARTCGATSSILHLVEPLLAPQLRGLPVVLVDDVMTSGASVFAAAAALRQAGVAHITALVMARTDAPG